MYGKYHHDKNGALVFEPDTRTLGQRMVESATASLIPEPPATQHQRDVAHKMVSEMIAFATKRTFDNP